MTHCCNHEVATGKYECPYADVVNNTITCNSDSCISNSKNMISYLHYYPQSVVNNLTEEEMCKLPDDKFPF